MGKITIDLWRILAFSQAAVAAVVASFLTWLVSRQGPGEHLSQDFVDVQKPGIKRHRHCPTAPNGGGLQIPQSLDFYWISSTYMATQCLKFLEVPSIRVCEARSLDIHGCSTS